MKVLGIIAEYNPFHNGHLYHIEQSKELTSASYVVCVMSGNFIQRGEPALVNKWARTEMALLSGADLIIELPAVYAMASAEYFAYGAVKLLDSLGITDFICFGSERGRIEELECIAGVLAQEPEAYKTLLKDYLSKGFSYPAARKSALKDFFKRGPETYENIHEILSFSNSILGIEYIKGLKKLGSKIIPQTIKRINNTYNSEQITGNISSATSIRKLISEKIGYDTGRILREVLPEASCSILEREFQCGRGPVFADKFENILLADIRRMTAGQLEKFPYISEGLENRIKEAAGRSGSFEELLKAIGTKRYPRTRIQRILFNLLTGITASDFDRFNDYGGPQYIRVLGFNQQGREMLSQINRKATLPVIAKAADYVGSCNPLLRRMLEIEATATDMYVLGYRSPEFRRAGQEYTQNIIRA